MEILGQAPTSHGYLALPPPALFYSRAARPLCLLESEACALLIEHVSVKTMAPEVKITPGRLPRFWDRNVLFFCNMHSIFYENQEQAHDLISQIYGAHSYGSRVVSILNLLFGRGPNKIFLEAPPEPNLLDYLSGDLQLSLPSFAVLDHRGYQDLVATLKSRSQSEVDPS